MPQCNVTICWRSLEWAMPWLVKFMFKEGADCSENIVLSCSRCRYLLIFTSGDFYFVVDGIFQKRWQKILRKITKYLLTLLHLVCHRWLTLDIVNRSYFLQLVSILWKAIASVAISCTAFPWYLVADNQCRDPMNNNKDFRVGQLIPLWIICSRIIILNWKR